MNAGSFLRQTAFMAVFMLSRPPLGAVELPSDPNLIARRALEAAPAGSWTLSGVLTTRTSDRDERDPLHSQSSSSAVVAGQRRITVQFRPLEGGGRETVYRSEDGESVEGVKILFPPKDGLGTIKLIDLGTDAPVKDMQASFLGSAFNMEDLSLRFLSWKTQELLGTETLKGRSCWKIASYPSRSQASLYARVESWIDQECQALLKALARDGDGRVIKEFNIRSFQQLENQWMLKNLDLNAPALKANSRLEILNAAPQ